MLKLLFLLMGLGAGATGATSWLLSLPDAPDEPAIPMNGDSLRARLDLLRLRLSDAVADGRRAGNETELRLKGELDAYRQGSYS